ncbi:MAG: hypothetical protein D6698_14310 [Gammaproteobacteria bacterium]|nr:MAG: hypothetical protein D6698_14310 [Gammaproteobacteria bacterium]
MAAWDIVKNVRPDFSHLTKEQVDELLSKLTSDDVKAILEDLEEEKKKLQYTNAAIDLVLKIGKAALEKLL